jgi:hypothetical protein
MDERPLFVLPSLAAIVGLNEAIFLQHLHWSLGRDQAQVQDSRRWIQQPTPDLAVVFPFWSESTIKRIVSDLKSSGVVLSKRSRDGNLYSIDYERMGQLDPSGGSTWPDQTGQSDTTPCKRAVGDQVETLFETPAVAGAPTKEAPDYVLEVWTLYVELFGAKLRIKELTQRRRSMIERAFKAAGGTTDEPESAVAVLRDAVRGLAEYRKAHPDRSQNTDLSVIFETGPQSRSNLTDQIEWWAKQAESIGAGEESMPSVLRDRVSRRKTEVVQMLRQPHNRAVQERGAEALAWLREHGINYIEHTDQTPSRIEWTTT